MQGRKNYTEKLFPSFQLSDRIPEDNLYRRLRETLDLSFLYRDTKELYGRTGNPSIDPVVFFKLLITGYLENITSDRKLVEHCSMRMDVLYFLGYDLDEELPWHSTISRTRQLYPETLFRETVRQGIRPLRRQRDGVRPYPGGGFGPDKGEHVHGKRGAENTGKLHRQPLEENIGGKPGNR
jgi:transposase